jgi:hypothetical protein
VTIPTVKIVRPEVPGGYCVINETDFDPATMVVYDPLKPVQSTEKPKVKAHKRYAPEEF